MESLEVQMATIERNGNKPEDWLAFIHRVKQESKNYNHTLRLCGKVASLIPPDENRKNISYARILVEFAKLQGMSSPEDARDTFRVARCNVKMFSIVYLAWAQFELSQGNRRKCKSILTKGIKNGAEPASILNQALHSCEQGNVRLLDDETEEASFTGIQSDLGKPRIKLVLPSLQSDSTLTGDQSMTGTGNTTESQVLPIQSSESMEHPLPSSKQDDSGVISFKLSENSEKLHPIMRQKLCSSSSSSSSGEDTAPLRNIYRHTIKATPDCKTVDGSSLSYSKNLSVRKSSARRMVKSNSLFLGPPLRGRRVSYLEDVEERNIEEEKKEIDNMDGIKAIHYNDSSLPIEDPVDTKENIPPQVSIETIKTNVRAAVLTPHEHVIKYTTHDKCHDNYSVSDPDIVKEVDPSRNTPYQNNVSINQVHHFQAVPGRSEPGRSETAYSPERSNCERHLKEVQHQNLEYPKQEAANQRYCNEFPGNLMSKDSVRREVAVNQMFPPGHTAINNTTLFVNGKPYLKLGIIGRGGSSTVVRAFDGQHICAVKHVSLEDADDVIIKSYVNEISMLKRLQGSDYIIKLYDWEQKKNENSIVLVLECGSIDLAAFLRKNRKSFTLAKLTDYWNQMLEAVNVIHNKGIIHSDLKPANFLLVEGRLKLIDFGIAIAIQADQTSIQRDTQVGTLNFMSPEAFQDISAPSNLATGRSRPCTKIGRPSDIWSLGCILYYMVYGRTPFQHITSQAIKLQCIMDENYAIEFPPVDNQQLLDVLKGCLKRNPRERYTIPQLLKHPFMSLGKQDPDEEQLYNCLLELTQAQVNSPRSIRVASKSICEQLRSGNEIDLSSILAKKQHLQHSMDSRKPMKDLNVQELPQSGSSIEKPGTSKY